MLFLYLPFGLKAEKGLEDKLPMHHGQRKDNTPKQSSLETNRKQGEFSSIHWRW